MDKVRAKFNVSEVTKFNNTGGAVKVTLFPVTSNSEENKSFWRATPSGKIEMYIDNPEASKYFEEFGKFYIDFIKAE